MKTTLRRGFIGHGLIALSLAKKELEMLDMRTKTGTAFSRVTELQAKGCAQYHTFAQECKWGNVNPECSATIAKAFELYIWKANLHAWAKLVAFTWPSHCSAVFINLMDTNSMLQQSFQHSDTISKVSASWDVDFSCFSGFCLPASIFELCNWKIFQFVAPFSEPILDSILDPI